MKRHYLIGLLLTLIGMPPLLAQLDSIHWLPPMHAGADLGKHYLYLTTPEVTPFKINISLGNGQAATDSFGRPLTDLVLSNQTPLQISLGDAGLGETVPTLVGRNELNRPVEDKGLILSGEKEFYCNLRVRSPLQGASLTTKGQLAKGTSFRLGHIVGAQPPASIQRTNFVSLMATEDSTEVILDQYDTGILLEDGVGTIDPGSEVRFWLDKGESQVLSLYYNLPRPAVNANGLLGSRLSASQPVVVSCGSWTGSPFAFNNQDIGIDQIVPENLIGTEYILVRGDGPDLLETPVVVATEDDTEIRINGVGIAVTTIQEGDYFQIPESYYSGNDNMFIQCSKPVYVYQMLAGANDNRTGGLNFVPSLGCSDESAVNNIMEINKIGNHLFEGKLFIVAQAGEDVYINGAQVVPSDLLPVPGNVNFVTRKTTNLSGLVDVRSTGTIQLGVFGRSNAVGWAGYFAGFKKIEEPEVRIETKLGCNGTLFLSKSDNLAFAEWYFNGKKLPFATDTIYDAEPGQYMAVGGKILCEKFLLDTSEIITIPEPLEYQLSATAVPCEESRIGQIIVTGLSGGYPPFTISVGGEQQTSGYRFDSLGPGVYPVRILDDFGCEHFDTIEVLLVPDIPVVALDLPDTLNCIKKTVALETTGSSDGSDFDYDWWSASGQSIDTSDSRRVLVREEGTYYLRITNRYTGCSSWDSTNVWVDTVKPVVTVKYDPEISCKRSLALAVATYSHDVALLDWQWDAPLGGLSVISPDSTWISKGGTVSVGITLRRNGCRDTATFVISENIKPPVLHPERPDTLNCVQTHAWLLGYTDADSSSIYYWYNEMGQRIGATGLDSTQVNRAGNYLWVVVDTSNGCRDSVWMMVDQDTIRPMPEVGSNGLLTCRDSIFDSQAYLRNCADCDIHWSTKNGEITGSQDQINFSTKVAGTYVLEVVNRRNGCRTVDSVKVEKAERPMVFNFSLIDPTCNERSGSILFEDIFGGTPPYFYSLDGGQTFSDERTFTGLDAGNYSLVIRDAYDCLLTKDTVISEIIPIDIEILEEEIHLTFGDSIGILVISNLPASLIDTIVWDPTDWISCTDCLDPVFRPFQTGYYWIRVVDHNGCVDTDRILFIIDRKLNVFIPNVFTPNNDGNNDGFTAFTDPKQARQITRFEIYDRWGEKVFTTKDIPVNDPSLGWQGDLHGEPMNPSVFTYIIEIAFMDGTNQLYSGDVTLIR